MLLKTHPTLPSRRQFYCPACDTEHAFNNIGWTITDKGGVTVSPSIRVTGGRTDDEGVFHEISCHLFIREGRLHYCKDSQHDMAGEVLPMIPYEDLKMG